MSNVWQIGDVRITRVIELQATGGSRFILPQATPQICREMTWAQPHFITAEGKLVMSVHALVIETANRCIVVDTCIGNDKHRDTAPWNMLQTNFLRDLEAAGYPRQRVDTVLCTHLHVDHVGWNTMLVDGQWIPTFPNARYLIGRDEWSYWRKSEEGTEFARIMADSVRPIFAAGLADEVDIDHRVCDEVSLEPTRGHTPGHVSVRIRSKGKNALITGDCIHHPCQIERLEWSSTADFDAAQAQATRVALLEKCMADETLMIGTHFATPSAGRVRKGANGYWLDIA